MHSDGTKKDRPRRCIGGMKAAGRGAGLNIIEAHDRNWTYLGIGSLVYQFPCKLKHTDWIQYQSSPTIEQFHQRAAPLLSLYLC